MEKSRGTQPRLSVRQLAIVGMLSAVSVILGLTGYGFIPLPAAKATIMHIPVIIGVVLEGPVVGMLIGLLFGLFSIMQNVTTPNILSFAFLNPLVSVLPRVLIALTTYGCYRMLAGKSQTLQIGLAAVVGSLTNTVGVLTMLYLLYAVDFAVARGISPEAAAAVIYGIALTNGIPEAIISALIVVPVVLAVKKHRTN